MLTIGLGGLGLVCVVSAAVLLRTVGRGYRLGRILWAAPQVDIADVPRLSGSRLHFVRVSGRVSSDEEFPDEHDRPLVFRRKRVQVLEPSGRWRTVADDREAVPFGVESRSDVVAVDADALGDGLVVVPREAAGRARDLPTDLLADLNDIDPEATARLLVEQISAVEQATVAGRPVVRDGKAMLTADTNRPLIVTTLDPPEAMRVLGAEHRGRVRTAAALLVLGAALIVLALLLGLAAPALAASPAATLPPSPAPSPLLIDPLDPRAGAGASLTGAPLFAAMLIVTMGVAVALGTIIYARLAARR